MLPFKVLILVVAACLVWITLISAAVIALTGVAASNGWIVAGALLFSAVAWVLVMIREIRNSVRMPDDFKNGESLNADIPGHELSRNKRMAVTSGNPMDSARSITVKTRSPRIQPHKARSSRAGRLEPAKVAEFFHPDV